MLIDDAYHCINIFIPVQKFSSFLHVVSEISFIFSKMIRI